VVHRREGLEAGRDGTGGHWVLVREEGTDLGELEGVGADHCLGVEEMGVDCFVDVEIDADCRLGQEDSMDHC